MDGYTEFLRMDLSEVAALLRRRELSSRALTEACLSRIRTLDPELHAVAGHDPEQALAAADRADALAADGGRMLPPLHGVPLAHKDMFYRRGRVSACGSRLRGDFVPQETAAALQRLDAAGALDIARLNMAEFALGATGHNEVTGTPRNPHAPGRVPGGSSSGSAVAVASGMVFGSLGSDTGGSVRQPAAFCGVVGLKPTPGRVSRAGTMPLSTSLDVVGPIARSARDAALLFGAIADDAPGFEFVPGAPGDVRGLRIAVPDTYFNDGLDAEISALLEQSLELFRALGARIVPVSLPLCDQASRFTSLICAVEGAEIHRATLAASPGLYGAQTRARLMAGLDADREAYEIALARRASAGEAFARALAETADVLFTPAMPMAAPEIESSDAGAGDGFIDYILRFGRCTRPFSYLGVPALSVPAGVTGEGLPAAFQLAGLPYSEALLLRAADAYEQAADRSWRFKALPPGRSGPARAEPAVGQAA